MFALMTAVALALTPAASARTPGNPAGNQRFAHVRTADAYVLSLLHQGYLRSSTFRHLVDDIERSDLIVYVETTADATMPVNAQIQLAGATPATRFLRIIFKIPTGDETAISLVGHELRHATEVARATEVRDQPAFEALYRRIGSEGGVGWETQQARSTGETIREELRASRGFSQN